MNKEKIDCAISYLSNDSKIKSLIEKYDKPDFNTPDYPFKSLIKYIIYQQLSLQSARAIYMRFLDIFNNNPQPIDVSSTDTSIFKSIGLSKQKIKYINEITDYFLSNEISFFELSNKEVYDKLISIKGIGPWTIDMFLIFTLHRTDVMPIGDLGIKKGFKILYDLEKLPTDKFMLEESRRWAPYQSIVSIYLWKIVDDGAVF
tara:strand:- start:405 stop:1010 length:606 start_codon:yes stop_codon:yes gene_type:complete